MEEEGKSLRLDATFIRSRRKEAVKIDTKQEKEMEEY